MATYVLIMLMWSPSAHAGGGLGTAEFRERASCEAAAQAAKREFDGPLSSLYYVCVPKSAS